MGEEAEGQAGPGPGGAGAGAAAPQMTPQEVEAMAKYLGVRLEVRPPRAPPRGRGRGPGGGHLYMRRGPGRPAARGGVAAGRAATGPCPLESPPRSR